MSLITGTIKQIGGTPANNSVVIETAVYPVVVGGALIIPDRKVVSSDDLGFWQCELAQGWYYVSATGSSGQQARVLINVPNDSLTHSFDSLITSDLPALNPPNNAVVPTGSPSQLGVIKTDTVDADPVAVLGFYVKATLAAMKAIPSKQSVKFVMLRKGTREAGAGLIYSFVFGDATVADGFNVVAPDDNGGRYFIEV